MAQIIRIVAAHAAIGFVLAAGFVAALLFADPGGLGTLLRHPSSGPLPLAMLWSFSGLTFGAVQFGAALWLAAED